ncbi:hypothetical protein [Listeria ilorinensis]|uniref:hypothetical protein n=1 Tax=Listeria ilorinensis TaxID=2867439 RepID=UPI001EF6824F|nr:hypothetical protein [Listeria ilorinensis]
MLSFDGELRRLGFTKGNKARQTPNSRGNQEYQYIYYRDLGQYTTIYIEGRLTTFRQVGRGNKTIRTNSDVRYTIYKTSYHPTKKIMYHTKTYRVDVSAYDLLQFTKKYLRFLNEKGVCEV